MRIMSVVGARPNFMKVAPIAELLARCPGVEHLLVHTGQHYDRAMSDIFFEELEIRRPDIFLGVGSASHAKQTAEIMARFEAVLMDRMPDAVLLAGDVNSTLACALVASKIEYRRNGEGFERPFIAHVESGLRSFDRAMPEEINRILTDHLSDLLFVTEESGIRNLVAEGIAGDKIHFVGNTMIDTLLKCRGRSAESCILDTLGISGKDSPKPYALATLHRPSNVDRPEALAGIIGTLLAIARELPVVFPAHPRTLKQIRASGLDGRLEGILLTPPLGYLDFMKLMSGAEAVLTDSGGIQEETTCLRVPCITLRENTERPVTVTDGTNVIAGMDRDRILEAFAGRAARAAAGRMPPLWDGQAAARIVRVLIDKMSQ